MQHSFLWHEIPAYKYFPTHLMERCGPKQWARLRLLQAFERLKIPLERWPKFPFPVLPRPSNHFLSASEKLSLPDFRLLFESEAEWRAKAHACLDELLDKELVGFREKLPSDLRHGLTPIKQTRDTTSIELRYEWAAKRLCYRKSFPELVKEEAARGKAYTEARIKQAVTKIITEAGLGQGK